MSFYNRLAVCALSLMLCGCVQDYATTTTNLHGDEYRTAVYTTNKHNPPARPSLVTVDESVTPAPVETVSAAPMPPVLQRHPLVIIRFNRPDVNYEDALFSAVNNAIEKYPSARFDIVTIAATQGDPNDAVRNGESVLRSMARMGMPVDRLRLSGAASPDAQSSEVHVYMQ